MERDPFTAPLDTRQRMLVDYALKLTTIPQSMKEDDITALRAAGVSDAAIHDAATITAYFNFVNRLASGLGVDLEEDKT